MLTNGPANQPIHLVILEQGKGDFSPYFLFLILRQHLSTAVLTFSGLLLSLSAFFLIPALRFIRGNTCPARDGLRAGTD